VRVLSFGGGRTTPLGLATPKGQNLLSLSLSLYIYIYIHIFFFLSFWPLEVAELLPWFKTLIYIYIYFFLAIGSDQSTLIGYKGGSATPKGQNPHNFFFFCFGHWGVVWLAKGVAEPPLGQNWGGQPLPFCPKRWLSPFFKNKKIKKIKGFNIYIF
jgi:hypothetical protein